MNLWTRQFFHPVGHGTFFTGRAGLDYPSDAFRWVYDCGSKRPTRIKAELDKLAGSPPYRCWNEGEQVDLFILSHFDDDHVNGVETFLSKWTVKWLALPYVPFAQTLAHVAGLTGEPCSASTALFHLDPKQWLISRALADRVDTILQVQGGPPPERLPDLERFDPPRDFHPERSGEHIHEPDSPAQGAGQMGSKQSATNLGGLTVPSSGHASGPTPHMATLNHNQPFAVIDSRLEFMFYNSEHPDLCRTQPNGDRVARRSGATISSIENEVKAIIKRFHIGSPYRKPKPKWRDALRGVYDKHFGHSGQARNNISLCLMTRHLHICNERCEPFEARGQAHPKRDTSTLLLGDLKVDPPEISAMKEHFGNHRWRRLTLVQVPHHGSIHSWQSGNARLFNALRYVQCVPDSSSHHPHRDVVSDLVPFRTLHADYRTGVQMRSHHSCYPLPWIKQI